ncbi:MAG: DNA polymerase III subunit gamma/tau [Bacillota bacterium]|jgi:DNA polymerase-3 subunit gamma/tau
MVYTALYRRFRPQLFSDLSGQDHISCTLKNAISQGSFVHAYLFCGPRGTGKTSTAKILARAVNCLNPQEGEPCGVCAACKRLLASEGMDIMEIDAASNRGIDEIRDLRERVMYAPAQEKYKVYIIDEVHMLTSEAFNALLKTLEEPPSHVLFILATTEPHKIPLTVLSRCQRFDFRRINVDDIMNRLALIAKKEQITIDQKALRLIAKKSDGGMRDAINLLDQCANFAPDGIDEQVIATVLGSVDSEFVDRMAESLCVGDLVTVFNLMDQLLDSGRDLRQFLFDLLDQLQSVLLARLSDKKEQLPEWAAEIDANVLLRAIQALGETDGRLRYSLQPRISFELGLLKACNCQELTATTVSPQKKTTAKEKAPVETKPLTAKSPSPEQFVDKTMAAEIVNTESVNLEEQKTTAKNTLDIATIVEKWPELLTAVKKSSIGTYVFLEKGRPGKIENHALVLYFPELCKIHMDTICKKAVHRQEVEKQLKAVYGYPLVIKGCLKDLPPESKQELTTEDAQNTLFKQ